MTDPDDFSPMVCPECLSRYEADCLTCVDCRINLEYRPVTGLRTDGKPWEAPKPQNWGGPREGSGRKTAWKHGETTVIRVPEALKDAVLQAARQLDEGQALNLVSQPGQLTLDHATIGRACELLAVHLEEVGRKGTLRRSVLREALALLESVT